MRYFAFDMTMLGLQRSSIIRSDGWMNAAKVIDTIGRRPTVDRITDDRRSISELGRLLCNEPIINEPIIN